uniref:U1-type domain-containing protein n=1 Tax=Sinocyclocheilus anshuiensis TaxID=1608454 RepID=A0A671NAD9_9TELE
SCWLCKNRGYEVCESGLLPKATDGHRRSEKKKLLYSLCEVCNIQLHSAAQAQVHYNGKSHLKRVKQLNNGELPTASVSSAPVPLHSLSSSSQGKTSVTQSENHAMF